jgi:hypothetical protein
MDTEGGLENKFMHANEGKGRFESINALIDRRAKLEAIVATVSEYASAEKGK